MSVRKRPWVSAHDSNTHIEGFHPTPQCFNNNNNCQQHQGILKNVPKKDINNPLNGNNNKAHVSFTDGNTNMVDLSQDGLLAQLSLQDSITSCFNLTDPDDDWTSLQADTISRWSYFITSICPIQKVTIKGIASGLTVEGIGVLQYRLKTIQGYYVPLRGAKVVLITVPTGECMK